MNNNEEQKKLLSDYFIRSQWNLTEDQLLKFALFLELIIENNKKYNLTGFKSDEDIILHLFLDSIEITRRFNLPPSSLIVDIGSGAGIPAIPLKILLPELNITIIESNQKKCLFLHDTVQKLLLNNISICNERSETVAHTTDYREHFHFVLSKAVAPLTVLVELSLPFLLEQGVLIAYKGANAEKELAEAQHSLHELGGILDTIVTYSILDKIQHHCFVVIKKTKKTSDKYPRKPGIPEKRPL